ncbi:hypothetical protein ACIBHX_02180 [Nonomuraea sp. NPDC050536]|uniref:hypothetical protein n=1 Tax=Nonomuraea sp. NPDC050536 TaxID=3364366 RepID=UPI0037C7572B
MSVWHGHGGIIIEVISLNGRPTFRVTRRTGEHVYLVGYCARVEELRARFEIDLADLLEEV